MKNSMNDLVLVLLLLSFVWFGGCKKDADGSGNEGTRPEVSIYGVSMITPSTAFATSNISATSADEITERGVCWNTDQNPSTDDFKTTDGKGSGTYSSRLSGLTPNTQYYVRSYAMRGTKVYYGNLVSFRTEEPVLPIAFNYDLSYGSVSDIEGNTYKTVQIGNKTWMAENLRTTHFNDGTEIPLVESTGEWISGETAAYCWYFLDSADYKKVYGALYNWYAVANQKVCPTGWHVANNDEFEDFSKYATEVSYGDTIFSVRSLMEYSNVHWRTRNISGTNLSGWTALPAGSRTNTGVFTGLGSEGAWWIHPGDIYAESALGYVISDAEGGLYIDYNEDPLAGWSVRCVKD